MKRTIVTVLVSCATLQSCLSDIAIAEPRQVIVYGDGANASRPEQRAVSASGIALASSLSFATGDVRRVEVRASMVADELVMLLEGSAGNLRLRHWDGSWSSDFTINNNVSGGTERGFGVAYETRSGEALVVYRRAGLSNIYFRSFDGTISGEQSVDLGFVSVPERVMLRADPGSDAILLVASDASSVRAAMWDGGAFGGVQTIDASFSGHQLGWDVTSDVSSGAWIVVWARSGDTSARYRTLADDIWSAEATGPSAGNTIERIKLTTDPQHRSDWALCALGATSGAAYSLGASEWDGSTWSATATIENDLGGDGAYPFDLSFEGVGGQALIGWVSAGDSWLKTLRWSKESSWSVASSTATIGDDILQVLLAPLDAEGGVVVVARREEGGEYVVYTDAGALDLNGAAIIGGEVGVNVAGVALPEEPVVAFGLPDLTYGDNADVTIAPGEYGNLWAGNNTTLRFSAGQYVFKDFVSDSNVTQLVFDTSGGDVEFVIDTGSFLAKNVIEITRSGDGVVMLHVNGGDFTAKNNAVIEAVVVVHSGSIQIGLSAEITGHLFASGNIAMGNNGVVTLPPWTIPSWSGGDAITQTLTAITISAGAIGSMVDLNSTGWIETWAHPMAVSSKAGKAPVRIVRWDEVSAQ